MKFSQYFRLKGVWLARVPCTYCFLCCTHNEMSSFGLLWKFIDAVGVFIATQSVYCSKIYNKTNLFSKNIIKFLLHFSYLVLGCTVWSLFGCCWYTKKHKVSILNRCMQCHLTYLAKTMSLLRMSHAKNHSTQHNLLLIYSVNQKHWFIFTLFTIIMVFCMVFCMHHRIFGKLSSVRNHFITHLCIK